LKAYYLIFISLFALIGCHFTEKESPDRTKAYFLATADISLGNEVIQNQMDSLKVSLLDVYKFCQKKDVTFEQKNKFINCVYDKVENYLQEENPAYWMGVLYDLKKFNEVVRIFKEPHHKTFLDVGSGNGEKPYSALCLGFEKSYGIEYSERLVKISRRSLQEFVQLNKIEIIHQDALKAAPEFYAQIDFIYLYSPIKDNKVMAELFHKILQQLKEGALLLELRFVYARELREISGLNFPELSDITLKKENNRLYYARYHDNHKEWIALDTIAK
jgi:SAM-dependent methyltransferase